MAASSSLSLATGGGWVAGYGGGLSELHQYAVACAAGGKLTVVDLETANPLLRGPQGTCCA